MCKIINYDMLMDKDYVNEDCKYTEGVLREKTDYLKSMFDRLSRVDSVFHAEYSYGRLTVRGEWFKGRVEVCMYLSEMLCLDGVVEFEEKFGSHLLGYDSTAGDLLHILSHAGFSQVDEHSGCGKYVYRHDTTGVYAIVNIDECMATCNAYAVVDVSKVMSAPLCNWEIVHEGSQEAIVCCDVGEDLCYDLGYLFSVFSARGFKNPEELLCNL